MTLFMFVFGLNAQAQNSVILNGKVEAGNSNIEKIHVINLTLEKGAVTNKAGEFQILANQNDSLYVSSVQFQNKTVVVTQEMIKNKSLSIYLQNTVNELAEVVIDDIQLSGYLANDLKKISVADVENKYTLQNNLNSFIEKDKKLNPYGKPNPVGRLPIAEIAGMVIDKLSSPKEQTINYTPKEIANKSISIVGQEFFSKTLELNQNEVCNFVYFCTRDSHFKHLVINNNALVLIEYFQTRIEDFRSLRGSALNINEQIPG